MGMRIAGLVAVLLMAWSTARSDVVTTVDGASFEGNVVSNDALGIVVETTSGTVTLPKEVVRSVGAADADPTTAPALRPGQRLRGWLAVVTELSAQPWAREVRQIPATVIDKGVMRNVPYQSYRCGGGDYELNIYGDPDDPAAVELGIYRDLLKDPKAKQRCADFIALVLIQRTDAGIVRAADLAKDLITRNGLTVEVTPETAEDAYGGWWISVYSETSLDQARASQEEMKAITVTSAAKTAPPLTTAPVAPLSVSTATTPPSASTPPSLTSSATVSRHDSAAAITTPTDTWTSAELAYARPSRSSAYGSGGPKTVYVRGYTRRDGTYVHSYTRSAPGRGHSSVGRGGGRR